MFFDRFKGTGYVCAHRGARALAPENTMFAAELGLKLGADFWETDVHKLDDGSLIIHHDEVLTRTTNVEDRVEFSDRKPWDTHHFTLDELRSLDFGSWFLSADPYGTVASGEVDSDMIEAIGGQRIMTLREALSFSLRNDFPVNIEIKDQLKSPGDLSIVSDVLKMIREMRAEELVLISSFNHSYLSEMRRLAPDIPIAVLVEDQHPDNIVEYLTGIGAATYHPDEEILDTDLVRFLTSNGIRVTPFTVNDMDRAVSLIDAGCFGITTDYTHSLRRLLDGRLREVS